MHTEPYVRILTTGKSDETQAEGDNTEFKDRHYKPNIDNINHTVSQSMLSDTTAINSYNI